MIFDFRRRNGRTMKTIRKILSCMFFFVFTMLFFSVNVGAYIDPSAMTFLIQVVAGVVIAAGAACGYYFRKVRRAVRKKKNREEDEDDEEDEDENE